MFDRRQFWDECVLRLISAGTVPEEAAKLADVALEQRDKRWNQDNP